MKITGADAYLCHFPLPEPFYPSWIPAFPQTNNSLLLMRITTDEGIEGVCAGIGFANEWKGFPDLIRVFLINRDPFQVEEAVKILRSAKVVGFRAWFIEIALWDIIGKATGQPIYRLLGGCRDRVKAYASTGELRGIERRVEDVQALLEQGFKGIKLRIRYPEMREDIALVEAVRAAVGDEVELMVDANQAWLIHGFGSYPVWDFKRALATARELEKLGVTWLEEPLRIRDYHGLAELRRATSLPIAGGELNEDLDDFRELIGRGCYDILQPDVTFSGGILMGRKIAAMAEAAHITYNPHTWTNGVGLAANLQLMGAIPNCTHCEFPYEPPGWVPEARDAMLTEPLWIDGDGYIKVPDKPGLGVEIDWDKVEAHSEKI